MFWLGKSLCRSCGLTLCLTVSVYGDDLPPLVTAPEIDTSADVVPIAAESLVPPSPVYDAAAGAVISQSPPPPPAPAAKPAAPKPPPQPWKPMFFDNDFSYKKQPNPPHFFGEELKDIPATDLFDLDAFEQLRISTGGEIRFRYLDETNRLRPGGPGHSDYQQWRWRHYVDIKQSDWIRAYVEMIDGSTFNNDLPQVGIDTNRWDLQNYLVDVKVGEVSEKPVWFRVGRQELFYGNQRLISPLDWSNIRRNFEGLKVFTKNDEWDYDLWLVNPVNTASPQDQPLTKYNNEFDVRNRDVIFGGSYWTYKAVKDHTFDLFLLWSHSNLVQANYPEGDRYTLGTRWLGNHPVAEGTRIFHAEIEGGYQFGNDRSTMTDVAAQRASVQAGYFTGGVGHTWKAAPWEPNLWIFYDWASGDQDPTDGQNNTFFQHYGLVHAYFGLIDNIARQNIQDVNYRFTVKPHQKMSMQIAQHWFMLANQQDVLYNVAGVRVGTPNNGADIGQELDVTCTFTINPNWSLEGGYYWFWYGDYIARTAPRESADQIYLMSTLRY